MALEKTQEGIFRLFGFVFQRTLGAHAVVLSNAGLDLALLRKRDAQHVEGLVGGALDGAALRIKNFYREAMAATVDIAQRKNRAGAPERAACRNGTEVVPAIFSRWSSAQPPWA